MYIYISLYQFINIVNAGLVLSELINYSVHINKKLILFCNFIGVSTTVSIRTVKKLNNSHYDLDI